MGLARVLKEGEHGGVAVDPVLETLGNAERGSARRVGSRGVLPTDVSEDEMPCGIGGPEVVDIGVVEGESGEPEAKQEGTEKQGEGGVWPDVALLAVIRVRRANRACRMGMHRGSRGM